MLRKMTASDVAEIACIHESSWSPEENSVRLGRDFLRAFYAQVVSSRHSFGYVYTQGDAIVAYGCGFYDYDAFNAALRRRHLLRLTWIVVSRLLAKKISWREVVNLLNDGAKNKNSSYPKHHWGATAVANEFKSTPEGKVAYRAVIAAVLDGLRDGGCAGCWGLTDERNIPMRKVLENFGFRAVETIPVIGKRLILYDKAFKAGSASARSGDGPSLIP
jgi:hypothetical protein